MLAVRLSESEAMARLASGDHGVLCTLHPARGVDAVPVVYVMDRGWVGVPVDLVKPKGSTRLQREHNLRADPRATLLIEHWDRADWARLWWVRAELRWQDDADAGCADGLAARLAGSFVQYRDRPFERILVFRVLAAVGWSGSGASTGPAAASGPGPVLP